MKQETVGCWAAMFRLLVLLCLIGTLEFVLGATTTLPLATNGIEGNQIHILDEQMHLYPMMITNILKS